MNSNIERARAYIRRCNPLGLSGCCCNNIVIKTGITGPTGPTGPTEAFNSEQNLHIFIDFTIVLLYNQCQTHEISYYFIYYKEGNYG